MKNNQQYDVIIIGGSYAGLSAAMALGRSLRNVLIIDSGKPCNRFTAHSHNFITHDGEKPAEIAAKAKEQVLEYEIVKFHKGFALSAIKTGNLFEIKTESGEYFSARKLIFATGIKDIFPYIKEFEECWGKSVIHCPYCHGYEFRRKKTAIVANAERAFHLVSLVNNLTPDIKIIVQGKSEFSEEQTQKLNQHQIPVIEKEIAEIIHQNGQIEQLIFNDRSRINVEAAYFSIPFEQHCKIPRDLGCELNEMNLLKTDSFQKTTVPGIYACGDNCSPIRSVAYAVATGNIAGAMVNHELCAEYF